MKTRIGGMAAGLAWMAAVLAAPAFEVSEKLRLEIQRDVEAVQKETPQMGEVMAALRETGAGHVVRVAAERGIAPGRVG